MKLKDQNQPLYFNRVELTQETIQKTQKWFADNALACIEEVKSGKYRVNDPELYYKEEEKAAKEYIEGNFNITLTFLQRAYFIQTGESVALLP